MAPAQLRSWKKIAAFYGLTLLLSSVFYTLVLKTGKLRGAEMLYVTGLMWCPALAGLITQRAFGDSIGAFGWAWGQNRFHFRAYLLPIAYALPVYLLVWGFGFGGFDLAGFAAQKAPEFGWSADAPLLVLIGYMLLAGSAGMVLTLSRTLGEEIGWRGFLVPELMKVTGFTGAALISGLMWAAWHFPLLLFADYNTGAPAWFSLSCFTVMVIGLSFVINWLRLASGSLWTAALLHASHNRFIQSVFTPLTSDTGNTNYWIDEFGIGLAVTCLIAAVLVTRHRNRKLT